MGVGDIFEIGKQGLAANRQALQTTSNNIANANTPGYSRQRPVFEAREAGIRDGLMIGGGVDVPKVIRVHDTFVERQIVEESKALGTLRVRSEGMKHLESALYNEGFELGESMNRFFNSYRELSANPEAPAVRSLVADAASATANSFRALNDSLDTMKRDLDLRLENMVKEVNANAHELAEINEKVARYEALGQSPNELYDRRDVLVRDLSQKLGYPITTNERGQIGISATGLGILVEGNEANDIFVQRTPEDGSKSAGSMDIYVKDSFGLHKVTHTFHDGEISGMLHVRDNVINQTLNHIDNAAYQFSREVNNLHRQGVGLDGQSERGLFVDLEGAKGAAGMLDISDAVKENFEVVATGMAKSSPGDNRIALQITDLQNKELMPTDGVLREGAEPRYTLNESLNSMVGGVATQTAKEDQLLRHQESIMGQLDNYRQSISGVSLDEEAIHMIQYQAVFNASAKTMKVGDELLQTILSLKD